MNYSLAIIGGGPAGYTAAEEAARAGLTVILFEKNALGGVCLNEGCIPTKTLLYSAKLYDHCKVSDKYGIGCDGIGFDLAKIIGRKNKVIRKLTAGIRSRLNTSGVTVVNEEALMVDYSPSQVTLKAGDSLYCAEKLLLATGSETFVPPINGLDQCAYWISADALNTKEIPTELLIVGGGVIGMEFASFFSSMGSKVTVVEMLPEILGGMDGEIASLFREECRKKGIRFYLSASVLGVTASEATIRLSAEDALKIGQEELSVGFDRLLMAAGRRPVIPHNLPLEMDGRRLKINRFMQTSLPNVYACGDITGFSMLAHTAERESSVAVHHMLGIPDEMCYESVPGVVYTSPEVAAAGSTEEQLRERQIGYRVKKIPMSYAGRFVVENEGLNGLCKILVAEDNTILGVHMLGTPASEFVVAAVMAIEQKMTVSVWEKTIFPHPTVSEVLKEALRI